MAPSTHSISDLVKRDLRRDTVIKAGGFHLREKRRTDRRSRQGRWFAKNPSGSDAASSTQYLAFACRSAPRWSRGRWVSFADQENQRAPEHRFCNFPATHKNGITHQASFSFAPN